ncbi:MAG TPA: hypothetical protein VFX24_01535 [Ktedonobacterales bacterium]|nr:hypothetical protein [Ktedonobacterales bacterium]
MVRMVEQVMSMRGWRVKDRDRASGRHMPRRSASVLLALMLALVLASCAPSSSASDTPKGNAASLAIATWQSSKPFDPAEGAPLPTNRIVAVYGIVGGVTFNGPASNLDLLNSYLPQLQDLGNQYAKLDPTHPVKLGLDLVVNVIQPCYSFPKFCASWADDATLQAYVDYCQKHNLLLFFDLQLGVQPVADAVNSNLMKYLSKYSFVELALDTEFHFPNTPQGYAMAQGYPCCLGWMDATEINWTIDTLANISLQNHLPRKVLVIHQWNYAVLTNKNKIKLNPDVSIVLQSDGFGATSDKLFDYQVFVQKAMIQYGGYKLFFQYPGAGAGDNPLQTPAQVMQVYPQPLFISYE